MQSEGRKIYIEALNGAPGRIRTSGLLIRSQSLYPAELRAHFELARLNRDCVRKNLIQSINKPAMAQMREPIPLSLRGRGDGFRFRSRRRNKRKLFNEFKAGAAQQVCNGRAGEPGGVVFHAHGARFAVEMNLPDAVDLAHAADGERNGFSGLLGVAEENFDGGHRGMIKQGTGSRDQGTERRKAYGAEGQRHRGTEGLENLTLV